MPAPEKNANASKRRRLSQQAVRERLRAMEYIRRLHLVADSAKTCEPDEVPRLRLQMDVYSRLLAKCLPDLKAIEHSGTVKRVEVSAEPLTPEQWAQEYGGVETPAGATKSAH